MFHFLRIILKNQNVSFRKKVLPLTAPPWIPYNNLSLCVLLSCFCFLSLALFSLADSVCQLGNDKLNGSDSVVGTRKYLVEFFRIAVCISDTDQSDSKCVSFLYTDSFLLRIYDKDSVRDLLHFLDTAKVLLKLLPLFL